MYIYIFYKYLIYKYHTKTYQDRLPFAVRILGRKQKENRNSKNGSL